jgi:excisionase family DNA binding protein
MESEIFTVERAAALANCSSRTIERALASGALTATRVGTVRQISHSELDRFIKSRQDAPAEVEAPEPVEPKHWSIQVGAMSPVNNCGRCHADAKCNVTQSWRIFWQGACCCSGCGSFAPPELLSILTKLTAVGQPSDSDRWYGVFSKDIPVASNVCPIRSKEFTLVLRDHAWMIGAGRTETKLLSIAGAEDACPNLAKVIHAHRGTSPAIRVTPPAPKKPDPAIAERAKVRLDEIEELSSIVWPVGAQGNPEVNRRAGLLLDFIVKLIERKRHD